MGNHHFFTSPDHIDHGRVILSGAEGRHASRVLRVRAGERISVSDGRGRVVEAVVTRVDGEDVEARVILAQERPAPRPSLTLVQGVARGERMDLVVQKAVEVGVRRVVPFLAARTIVRWDDRRRQKARDRWTSVALSAAKQSRSAWIPEVGPVVASVGEALGDEEGLVLVLHEEAVDLLRTALPPEPPAAVTIVVGPEGGLEDREVAALAARGGRPVSLGERILRTETAGPVAAALVSFAYGTLG